MKRILFIIAFLVSVQPLLADGAYDEIRADVNKAGGVLYVDDFSNRDLTPAPKGYQPFYISAYIRHGSRFLIHEEDYAIIKKALSKGHKAGILTSKGEDFRRRFEAFLPTVENRAGDLAPRGQRQHKALAAMIYNDYKPVFKGKDVFVDAHSTHVGRAIMSMNAFFSGLKACNKSIQSHQNASMANLDWINPHMAEAEIKRPFDQTLRHNDGPWYPEFRKFCEGKLHTQAFLESLFNGPAPVKDAIRFERSVFEVASNMQDMETEESFWDLFDPDEIAALWECENLRFFMLKGRYPLNYTRNWKISWPILDNFLTKADEDLASGKVNARLRFGHDGCMMTLLCLMGAKGWCEEHPDFNTVKDTWHSWNIPMAANLVLAFYRNKKGGDILVKFTLNGKNLTLPLEAVEGPYYRWDDFRSYYRDVTEDARAFIESCGPDGRPYILSGRVSCDGKPLEGVKVSDGVNIVKTDADGRYAMFSDKRQGFVFVIQPSGYVPLSADGIKPEFYARLNSDVTAPEVHDFRLRAENQDTYTMLMTTDAHLTNADFKPDQQAFREIARPNILRQAEKAREKGPVYSVELGDLAHELYWKQFDYNLRDAYGTFTEGYPTLLYCVSGNHDNDGGVRTANTDRDAEWLFREVIGPEYYAMEIGGDHWIMLDDVIYRNSKTKKKLNPGIVGDRSYDKGLTQGEMAWLIKYLEPLADDSRIKLCLHVPILAEEKESGTYFRKSQADSLQSLFARFGKVEVFCGHVHKTLFTEDERYPVFEQHALPALSGNMWTLSPVVTMGEDGGLGAVYVGTFSEGESSFELHSHEQGQKWLRIYDMNTVRSYFSKSAELKALREKNHEIPDYTDPKYANCIWVNYWYWHPGDIVEILENGRALKVEKITEMDPLFDVNYNLNGHHKNIPGRRIYSAKARTRTGKVLVRIRNREGEIVYEEALKRPKAFSPVMQ